MTGERLSLLNEDDELLKSKEESVSFVFLVSRDVIDDWDTNILGSCLGVGCSSIEEGSCDEKSSL